SPNRKSGLLVEVDSEILAIRSHHLESSRRLVANLLVGDGFGFETFVPQWENRYRDHGEVDCSFRIGNSILIQLHLVAVEIAIALVDVQHSNALTRIPAEVPLQLLPVMIDPLRGALDSDLIVVPHKSERALALPGNRLDLGQLFLSAKRLNGLID